MSRPFVLPPPPFVTFDDQGRIVAVPRGSRTYVVTRWPRVDARLFEEHVDVAPKVDVQTEVRVAREYAWTWTLTPRERRRAARFGVGAGRGRRNPLRLPREVRATAWIYLPEGVVLREPDARLDIVGTMAGVGHILTTIHPGRTFSKDA